MQSTVRTVLRKPTPSLPVPELRPSTRSAKLFLLVLSCSSVFVSLGGAKERPNVLFIAVDDMRVELGCYGNPAVKSPNIDRLASQGTLFQHAYCQQAVCNPSRASMLTGLRPSTLQIWDLPTHFRQKFPEIVTLPQHFKQSGYHTQCLGKIFHNWRQDDYKGDAPSWSVAERYHYNSHGNDKAIVDGPLPENQSNVPKCIVREVPDEAYFDGRIAKMAVESLGELAKKDQPFFLAVGFWKPHSHFNAPKKYWDLYTPNDIPPLTNPQPPTDVPAIALHDGREICRSFTSRPGGRPTAADAATLRHGYYASISYVDAQVGRVLNELERLDLDDKTIIVFWSDHGFHLGEHGLWAKTSNFELDARVPMIIATPDDRVMAAKKGGERTDAIVELLDVYPTLLDLCNLPQPQHELEGVSLKTLLRKPESSVKAAAFTWHPRPAYPAAGKNPEAMGHSLRTQRYRYTEWRDFESGRIIAQELYDHQIDPHENHNVAKSPKSLKIIKKLQTLQLGK
jgi:iduronate 2-sulfatase